MTYLNFHNRKNTSNKYKKIVLQPLQNIQHSLTDVKISRINALPYRYSYS